MFLPSPTIPGRFLSMLALIKAGICRLWLFPMPFCTTSDLLSA